MMPNKSMVSLPAAAGTSNRYAACRPTCRRYVSVEMVEAPT